MKVPSWHELFFRHVYLISSKSKDPRTKVGSVLVKDNRMISEGYNGICRGVKDDVLERSERPEKYFWYEHAERNSVFSCAYLGNSSLGSTCYTNGIPCCDCARALIQAGIKEIYVHQQWIDHEMLIDREKWKEHTNKSFIMLGEANIPVIGWDLKLGIESLLDGREVTV